MATTNTAIRIMQLSEAEYTTLSTQGTLIKDGVTYTYSPNDTIYVTPNSNVTLAQFTTALATKQDTLVSGTSIKTINSTSVLGSGDISVQPVTAEVTLSGTTQTLADNTDYTGTGITSMAFTFPNGNFECYISLTTASSGTIAITFPNDAKWIGEEPSYENSKQYEFSVKNGVIVAGVVE